MELGGTIADFSTPTMTMLWLALSFYTSQKVTFIIYKLDNMNYAMFEYSVLVFGVTLATQSSVDRLHLLKKVFTTTETTTYHYFHHQHHQTNSLST